MSSNILYRSVLAGFVSVAVMTATPVMSFAQEPVQAVENEGKTKTNAPAVFFPTSAWLVGPISVIAPEDNQDMPCVMANHYDNGYGVRFSGNDREILAVAIDFRKDLFQNGEGYDLGVRVGSYEKTLSASAYDGSTLVMNTERSSSLYNALLESKGLVVTFGKTDLPFSLLGAGDGLKRMSSCYSSPDDRDRERKDNIENSLRADVASFASNGNEPVDAIKPHMGVSVQGGGNVAVAQDAATVAIDDSEAEHDPVSELLDGFMEKAITPLPAEGASTKPTNETARSFPAEARPRPIIHDPAQHAQQAAQPAAGVMQWSAQQGGDLKDVLNVWTSHKKVGLLWGVKDEYYLPRRFEYMGTFEDAVRAVLAEFSGDALKPRAKLYNDNETGKAFLLIEYETGE